MHITCLQENILKAIQDASRCISAKPQLPILSGIHINATNGEIIIQATDLRVGFHTVIGGKIEEEGSCVIPAKVFTELVSSLSAGSLELVTDDTQVHLTQGRSKAKLPIFPSIDFPPFPKIDEQSLSLPAEMLFSLVDQTAYAASLDETRPVIASVLLQLEGNRCVVVATDGYRLVASSQDIGMDVGTTRVLLNAKMCGEIMRILARFKPQTIDFAVSSELQQVKFGVGNTVVLARLTEGEFPPYQRIIPTSFMLRSMIDREALLHALKTALVIAKESSSIVTLQFSSKAVTIKATSATLGENEVTLDSTYDGEEKNISFNAKFVMDALSHMKTSHVEFCMNDELKPAVLFPQDDDSYTTVIMPFKR